VVKSENSPAPRVFVLPVEKPTKQAGLADPGLGSSAP